MATTVSPSLVRCLFFLTGIGGLIYEVVWSRMFSLVLGTTVNAVATVLGVFMGGMAIGSWVLGRIADRKAINGLRLYGYLELAVGLYALATPWLLSASNDLYRAAWPWFSQSGAGLMSLRVLLAVVVLIVPAALMGGTLPVLSRFLVQDPTRPGGEIGALYAINTLGAVVGCLLTGFFLLELLGVQASLWTAAGLNGMVGVVAILCSSRITSTCEPRKEAAHTTSSAQQPKNVRLVLILFGISGCAALALEVLWTRSLMYFVSMDSWAFTAMLATFLCGIGIGSLLMSRRAGRLRCPLLTLAIIELLIGVTATLSLPLLRGIQSSEVIGAWSSLASDPFTAEIIGKLLPSFAVMLAPTLLMGAAFPVVTQFYVGSRGIVGRGTGTLYALNTLGSIFGSLGAGFVLIPIFGVEKGILVAALLYMAIGLILLTAARPALRWPAIGAAATALIGVWLFQSTPVVQLDEKFRGLEKGDWQLVHHHEGADASLAVLENRSGVKALNINGVITAGDNFMDLQVHRMLSHLPVLLHPDPERVLVVGFGMGSTVWGCCQHDVDRVDVVEMIEEERRAARFFERINHGVLDHPRLSFIHGDGRNHLLATRERYDVISFNAVHPRYSANLYTEDFYAMCRERLTENGVICAWMTQNSLSDAAWRMLCRSLTEVFPHSSLWYCNPEHFCLIGSLQPLRIDLENWRHRTMLEDVSEDLRDSHLDDPLVLLGRFMMGTEKLRAYLGDGPMNTDDRPRIEFTVAHRRAERQIIEQLVGERESILPNLISVTEEQRQKILAQEDCAGWLMQGQIEHWYPLPGQPLASEIAHRKALLRCPDNEDVRVNLFFSSDLLERLGSALEKNPRSASAALNLGRVLLERGELERCQTVLAKAQASEKTHNEANRYLAFALLYLGQHAQSADLFASILQETAVLREDPITGAMLLYALGVAQQRKGEKQQSAQMRAEAIKMVPQVQQLFELRERCIRTLRAR